MSQAVNGENESKLKDDPYEPSELDTSKSSPHINYYSNYSTA
jgi:hypothetical protein